ncbi:UNVERIFIED_CONTAM: hypothetical protein GTU68_057680 [Idotea baltica]|nr:hypothetical protein [Idotea baltica]
MLEVNELAKEHDYYLVGSRVVSPNNQFLAFGEDTLSRRIFTIRFKDLRTGTFLKESIPKTSGKVVWADDNKTLFYTRKDEALRPHKVFRHILGTDPAEDEEIFHEADESFSVELYKTKSKKYIIIGSYATLSNEYHVLRSDAPLGDFELFAPREYKHEHFITHANNQFFIRTNWNAPNFRLMQCSESLTSKDNWQEIIAHRSNVLIENIEIFVGHWVLSERVDGLTQLRVRTKEGDQHHIDFGQETFSAYTTTNREYETDKVRIGFTSLNTPNTVYDYDMSTRKLELLKQVEVVGSFSPHDYHSERVSARASDGTMIPISIVYRKGFEKNGQQPLLLYGYGSYGISIDPTFSSARLSLLDRGFAFAIAHVRGGQEMGRQWYEDGKFLQKKNTFTDFIACGRHLVEHKFASPKLLFAMGGSAGGLLMGAVINMAPSLFKGVLAAVPFVDVVTTMLDESIPLTTGEYDEWGNPNDQMYYTYMKSYSPYDNVTSTAYPAILVTTGLHDSQVQYWEPAKWVAKLRDLKTDQNILLLHTNMETGHGGASGRFTRHKETAMEYAFFLDMAATMSSKI